jgi:SAM-dependent methyltransferase
MNESQAPDRPEPGRHQLLRDPDAFDREIRHFVPSQADILESLIESLLLMEDCTPVLELGCRTGILSSHLVEEKPYVRLTAVDPEPFMIQASRERLGRSADWVDLECRSLVRYARAAAFDYVLSNLSLHFLESQEDKEAVCRNVFWSLRPGGLFAFSVMLDVGSNGTGEGLWKQWELEVMGTGTRRQDIQEWHQRTRQAYSLDSPQTWLARLRAAGFVRCELVWSETIFGTFWAKKPADKTQAGVSGPS